jgi:hypothetical protein
VKSVRYIPQIHTASRPYLEAARKDLASRGYGSSWLGNELKKLAADFEQLYLSNPPSGNGVPRGVNRRAQKKNIGGTLYDSYWRKIDSYYFYFFLLPDVGRKETRIVIYYLEKA